MRAIRPTRVTMIPLAGLALLVSACSGMLGPEDSRAGLSCIDDSPECVERRQATLSAMLADKDRTWVKEPPTPQAHASGVRLFAFRSAKSALTCEELAHGRKEAEGAPKIAQGQPRPFTGSGFAGVPVCRRGQQGADRGAEEAPLPGLRPAFQVR